jgi:hypothetical protein
MNRQRGNHTSLNYGTILIKASRRLFFIPLQLLIKSCCIAYGVCTHASTVGQRTTHSIVKKKTNDTQRVIKMKRQRNDVVGRLLVWLHIRSTHLYDLFYIYNSCRRHVLFFCYPMLGFTSTTL